MMGKKVRIGKYSVRVCIICGTEIEEKRVKYCISCAREHWRLENNKRNTRKYWQKKGLKK